MRLGSSICCQPPSSCQSSNRICWQLRQSTIQRPARRRKDCSHHMGYSRRAPGGLQAPHPRLAHTARSAAALSQLSRRRRCQARRHQRRKHRRAQHFSLKGNYDTLYSTISRAVSPGASTLLRTLHPIWRRSRGDFALNNVIVKGSPSALVSAREVVRDID